MITFKELWHLPWLRIFKPGYRPNVAVIIQNEAGEILVAERFDIKGAIQMVQGGIDKGESVMTAGLREASEELGIDPTMIKPVAEIEQTWKYDWPKPLGWTLRISGYRGQEQHFILVEIPKNTTFNLGKHFREFRRVWWVEPNNVLQTVSPYKRPGIEIALKGFNILSSEEEK